MTQPGGDRREGVNNETSRARAYLDDKTDLSVGEHTQTPELGGTGGLNPTGDQESHGSIECNRGMGHP